MNTLNIRDRKSTVKKIFDHESEVQTKVVAGVKRMDSNRSYDDGYSTSSKKPRVRRRLAIHYHSSHYEEQYYHSNNSCRLEQAMQANVKKGTNEGKENMRMNGVDTLCNFLNHSKLNTETWGRSIDLETDLVSDFVLKTKLNLPHHATFFNRQEASESRFIVR